MNVYMNIYYSESGGVEDNLFGSHGFCCLTSISIFVRSFSLLTIFRLQN